MTEPSIRSFPEIGPFLGRLTDATRRFGDPTIGLDEVRLGLVTDLFERSHAARGFLSVDDFAGARAALDKRGWLEIWQGAAQAVADRVIDARRQGLLRAQRLAGCPDRVVKRWLPSAEDREMLAAKLEAAGIPLEEQVARGFPVGPAWWDAVRQAAVALEDSWEQLEAVVLDESKATARQISHLEGWRPSRAPWLAAGVGLTVLFGWLGLVLGGFLPRPSWLDPVATWFWSLPWP